jgi:hypothetical protein
VRRRTHRDNRNQWRGAIAKVAGSIGAPVSVFVAFRRDAYVVTEGQIAKFNSSPGRWRGFCARCGSTLTCEGERSNETHFHCPKALVRSELWKARNGDRPKGVRRWETAPRRARPAQTVLPMKGETYRVNGRARVRVDPVLKRRFAVDGKEPTTVIVVAVEQPFQRDADYARRMPSELY